MLQKELEGISGLNLVMLWCSEFMESTVLHFELQRSVARAEGVRLGAVPVPPRSVV